MEIKIDRNKKFVAARARIKKSILLGEKKGLFSSEKPANLSETAGYTCYSFSSGTWEIVNKKFTDNKVYGDYVDLLWVHNETYDITFPFGIPGKGHGMAKCKILNHEKFMRKFPIAWETVIDDEIKYEYASEYFINAEGKPDGISIRLREMIVPYISDGNDKLNKLKEQVLKPIGVELESDIELQNGDNNNE